MEHAKVFVFKEININNACLYLWYKLADEQDDNYIIPDKLLSYEEHLAALSYA